MAIVKVENKTYTVDPLYQWDQNQVLEIRGLSLTRVPEIHYTNTLMDRAVVRPASMDAAGIITTQVPNSLLQKASRITVYLCTYEGATFKTLYKLEIPVRARPMPSDYTFEDDAGEIYSFNALETQVANALTAAAQAKSSYTAAEQKATTAAQDLAACKALLEQATALYNSAEEKYGNALETLNGVEDGSVFLKKAGDEMAGNINMNNHTIAGLADPEADTDAATKGYVASACSSAMQLLWEAQDPTGPFWDVNEIISLDVSKYKLLLVCFEASVEEQQESIVPMKFSTVIPTVAGTYAAHGVSYDPNGLGCWIVMREVTIDAAGVSFSVARYSSSGTIQEQAGTSAIVTVPVAIYGLIENGKEATN